MKALTKNLIYYAILFFIGAVIFRYSLSHFLESHLYNIAWITAVIYFFFNFGVGWFFGKRDHESLPLYDIGFRFHLATYLLFNSVSIAWFLSGYQSQYENIRAVYLTAIFWGIGVLIHFILYLMVRQNSIKGLNKEELFE